MDLTAFEIIYELPREISTKELLGRKIFVKLNAVLPASQTVGEVLDWSSYSIKLPKNVKLSFNKYESSSIRYSLNHETNTLTLDISDETTSLETRTFIQYLITGVKNGKRKS